jgi:uncharacterized cupredoxin-like copper-binding protein
MTDYSFVPDEIKVPAGNVVRLTLINKGGLPHELAVLSNGSIATPPFTLADEMNVIWEVELQPGASQTVTFQAPSTPGEYHVVCGLPEHLERGMEGRIVVE